MVNNGYELFLPVSFSPTVNLSNLTAAPVPRSVGMG
ncbi:hypothetical protein FHT92_004206 [Rhizobium sp. BK377]|nr:hypothetical protein [Rhizobium sp. BK377]